MEAIIKERAGKIKGAIYLTAQIVESFQMQAMGGLMAAKVLWEGAIVPSLLSGASTWAQLSNRRYVDPDMLPGSYPHKKYMVCML